MMTMPAFLAEGWLNAPYSVATNESHPKLRGEMPGLPYFVDTDTAWKGQWVRLVFRAVRSKSADGDFWCVGSVEQVVDPNTVRVCGIKLEGGTAPKAFRGSWSGAMSRAAAGGWTITELGRDPAFVQAEATHLLLTARDRKGVVSAVEAARKEGVAFPETFEVITALLGHDDEDFVVATLGTLEGLLSRPTRDQLTQLLEGRVRKWSNDGEAPATRDAAERVLKLLMLAGRRPR